ncbi:MAG TPA: tetratricopeptide repeat protein [Puia sp.]|nr:tetratricopeptide repeat protein [Puia sp.]
MHAQIDSAGDFYQRGLEAKNKRLLMVAFNDFQKSMEYQPSNVDATREFGLAAVELRKYDIAKQAFLKLEKLQKDDSTAICNLAMLNFWTHQWQQATLYARKALELHVGQHWNYVLGTSFYEMEDYANSFKYLQAAAKEDSTNAEIPYLVARSFVDMNNYKSAIPFFRKAIALDSSRSQWIYECALTYATITDDLSAIKYYELAAMRGYKKDNDFYENLSDSYLAAGQPEKGLELMLQVLQKKPADLDLLYSIANTYYQLKKYDQAIDYWDKVLYFDKENAKSLFMIGMSYQKKGEEQKGRTLCDKAIAIDPSLKSHKQERKIDM